jgi:hypothetical protein
MAIAKMVLGAMALAVLPTVALADAPKLEKFRAYLIYEDTGKLSKSLAGGDDQIVANDEHGTSVQMVVDVVMSGKPDKLYENNPILHVVVHGSDPGTAPIVDAEFPLTFMAKKTLVRTVVVDHNCNGVTIDAYMMDGKKKTSEIKKSFSITCGD